MLPSATRLTQLAPKGSPLTSWLGLPIGQTPVFPLPPWQDAQVKPDRT
jgi:hypothetical protein